MSSETDTSRSVVQTYVPEYQKREWKRHAERLDMTQSEFVRAMVQAGRRGFDSDGRDENPEEPASGDANPGGSAVSDLETHVLDALADGEARSWDELAEAVTAHVERELEETLETLQAENRVRYSGPKGGYTLLGDE